MTINRVYKLVLVFSITLQLALFFMGVAVSLFIDQLFNGWAGQLAWYSLLYKVMFIFVGVVRACVEYSAASAYLVLDVVPMADAGTCKIPLGHLLY